MARLQDTNSGGGGLFTNQDFDLSGDSDVQKRQAELAEAQKHDVRRGFGLSQDTLGLADTMAARANAGGDYGLSKGTQEASGFLGPKSQQSFNAGLGGGQNDDALQGALQKRFNKGFQREAQGIKSKAQLQAQSLRSQDLNAAQQTYAQQQHYLMAQKNINDAQAAADRARRGAVLSGILGGAGAVAGSFVAPGAGTAAGAQLGQAAGGM